MNFTLFKLVELKVLNPSLKLCFYLPPFCLSLGSYFNLCYASALKCLSVCPLYLSLCLLCPVLAASTNRAVLAENMISSLFLCLFLSLLAVQFSWKTTLVMFMLGVTMIYRMTWLTAMALIGGVFGLFLFAGNGGLNCRRAVSAKTTKTTTIRKKKKERLSSDLKKQPSALKSGRIALFLFLKKM